MLSWRTRDARSIPRNAVPFFKMNARPADQKYDFKQDLKPTNDHMEIP